MEKKNIFSKYALKWVLSIGLAAGLLVGCKNYDDDIEDLQRQITDLQTAVDAINAKINSGYIVESVTPVTGGFTVKFSGTGGTYTIVNGATGATGAPGTVWTIGADGFWYVDGVKTTNKAIGEDGADGTALSILPNGNWAIDGVDTGIPASGISVVEQDNFYEMVIVSYGPDGEVTSETILLPKVNLSVTSVNFIPEWVDNNNQPYIKYASLSYMATATATPVVTEAVVDLVYQINPTKLIYGQNFVIRDITVKSAKVQSRADAVVIVPVFKSYDLATGLLTVTIDANDPALIQNGSAAVDMLSLNIDRLIPNTEATPEVQSSISSDFVQIAATTVDVRGDYVDIDDNPEARMLAYNELETVVGDGDPRRMQPYATWNAPANNDATRSNWFTTPGISYQVPTKNADGTNVVSVDMKQHIGAFFNFPTSLTDLGFPIVYTFTAPTVFAGTASVNQNAYMSLSPAGILTLVRAPAGATAPAILGKTPAFLVEAKIGTTLIARGYAMVRFIDNPTAQDIALLPNPLPVTVATTAVTTPFTTTYAAVLSKAGVTTNTAFITTPYLYSSTPVITVIKAGTSTNVQGGVITVTAPTVPATAFGSVVTPLATAGDYDVTITYTSSNFYPAIVLKGQIRVSYPAFVLNKLAAFWSTDLTTTYVRGRMVDSSNPDAGWVMDGNLLTAFQAFTKPDVYTDANFKWYFTDATGKVVVNSTGVNYVPLGVSGALVYAASPKAVDVKLITPTDTTGMARIGGRSITAPTPLAAGTVAAQYGPVYIKAYAFLNGDSILVVDKFKVEFVSPLKKPTPANPTISIPDVDEYKFFLLNGVSMLDYQNRALFTQGQSGLPLTFDPTVQVTLVAGDVTAYGVMLPGVLGFDGTTDILWSVDASGISGQQSLEIDPATGEATWNTGGVVLQQNLTIPVTATFRWSWNYGDAALYGVGTSSILKYTRPDMTVTFNVTVLRNI